MSWGTSLVSLKKDCGVGQPIWQWVDWCKGCTLSATPGLLHDIGACFYLLYTSIGPWSSPPVPGPLSPSTDSINALLVVGCWGHCFIQLGGDFPSVDRKGTPLWMHSSDYCVQTLPGANMPPSRPVDS